MPERRAHSYKEKGRRRSQPRKSQIEKANKMHYTTFIHCYALSANGSNKNESFHLFISAWLCSAIVAASLLCCDFVIMGVKRFEAATSVRPPSNAANCRLMWLGHLSLNTYCPIEAEMHASLNDWPRIRQMSATFKWTFYPHFFVIIFEYIYICHLEAASRIWMDELKAFAEQINYQIWKWWFSYDMTFFFGLFLFLFLYSCLFDHFPPAKLKFKYVYANFWMGFSGRGF